MIERRATIYDVPSDVLYQIVGHLHDTGASLRPFAQTCQTFYATYATLRHGGEQALAINLPLPGRQPTGLHLTRNRNARTGETTTHIEKTSEAGDAHIAFPVDVRDCSTLWTVHLSRFTGHRVSIGLALDTAFRFGTVERKSSWSFDCFGRACLQGRTRTYGRHMQTGDTLGVLYDTRHSTLTFLDNGVSMGSLPLRVPRVNGGGLRPFIYMPSIRGDAVSLTMCASASRVVDMRHVRLSAARWARPRALPFDRCVLVTTWDERTWYAVHIDDEMRPLTWLWLQVQQRHKMDARLFELIFAGRRLPNRSDITLKEAGVHIDQSTGTCASDVLLSVPHMVS